MENRRQFIVPLDAAKVFRWGLLLICQNTGRLQHRTTLSDAIMRAPYSSPTKGDLKESVRRMGAPTLNDMARRGIVILKSGQDGGEISYTLKENFFFCRG
jgi:hypothetical protein